MSSVCVADWLRSLPLMRDFYPFGVGVDSEEQLVYGERLL